LAHAHLEPKNENGAWNAIKIWNWTEIKKVKNDDKSTVKEKLNQLGLTYRNRTNASIEVKDLEIKFTWEQLYNFASRIADEHLKYYEQGGE